jgi:hypothetical protein
MATGGAASAEPAPFGSAAFKAGSTQVETQNMKFIAARLRGGGQASLGERTNVLQTWQIEKWVPEVSKGFRTVNCEKACRRAAIACSPTWGGEGGKRRLKRRCRFPGHAVSVVEERMWPPTDKLVPADPDAAVAEPGSAGNDPGMAGAVRNGRGHMNIDLEEIRAVFFRCNECRTAVSFPRIRWANLPENCPNCGAAWMKEPTSEFAVSEESAMLAFKAVRAFRDALQALISASRTIAFTIGFETGESGEAGEDAAKQAGAGSSAS